ncbi:hypothetical protein [Streptomyces sp. NPDC059861]
MSTSAPPANRFARRRAETEMTLRMLGPAPDDAREGARRPLPDLG